MFTFLQISPVVFALVGLIIFVIGQFLKGTYKILFSLIGLTLIGLFVYKLLFIQNESENQLAYTDRGNNNFQVSYISIYFFTIGLNILGLILWLLAIIKVTFGKSIPKQSQIAILLSGGLVMILTLIIYKLFNNLVGAVCFPIMTIIYFIGFTNYYKGLKMQ